MKTGRRTAILALTSLVTGTIAAGRGAADCSDDGNAAPESAPSDAAQDEPAADPNAVPQAGLPTLGGMQFWGDLRFFRGYKIQRNVFTGHYRLLDDVDRRYASGTLAECEAALDKLRQANSLKADTGHAVIFLHGIGRSSKSLRSIINAIPAKGHTLIPFEYPSTRVSLDKSADYLQTLIESLTDVERISFVVHSLGGLVVRRYLKDHRDPRLHRMVMMGTPNNGAELADMLKSNVMFKTIYGPAGQELVTNPAGSIPSLPTPDFEFGIVAGGKKDDRGFNRLLPGDNDGTVTVASARLAGAADFLLVPRIHSFLMSDETVIKAVSYFLEHGRFSPDRFPEPILPVPVAEQNQ